VLVDPGSPFADQQAVLDALLEAEARDGRRVIAVALTHHHGDHIGGAAHLQARWGAPVLAHPATAPLVAPRVKVDRLIDEGALVLGQLHLFVHHTPGHAIGHVCLSLPSAGVTAVGDMVAGLGTILIDPDEGDMAEYLRSLDRLASAAPGVLLPAHGPVIADGVGKLREYREHRLRREQKIAEALATRPAATAEELVPLAYADTPAPFWPLAVRSTLAHLVKLAREGRAVCDGQRRWSAREIA
jgi:glyoxylase-like metal-dependent hydrolase (beta-lactamase superfamily II)